MLFGDVRMFLMSSGNFGAKKDKLTEWFGAGFGGFTALQRSLDHIASKLQV